MAKKSDNGMELHQLIMKGDELALSKLFDLYSSAVARKLKSWYKKIAQADVALIHEAVSEAFLGYFRNPLTYNSSKASLQRFLEIASERDLKNILSKDRKQVASLKFPNDVELQQNFWNSFIDIGVETDGAILQKEAMELMDQELLNHFHNETDIRLAKLVIAEERETEVFSAVLELDDLEIEEQRAEVKRNKDRIKKVLVRYRVKEKLKNICNG